MRNVYVCVACAVHYLPPESMHYPTADLSASPVHCANPRCAAALESGMAVPPQLLAMIERKAEEQARTPRPRRPARGRRAAAAPGGARSKLH